MSQATVTVLVSPIEEPRTIGVVERSHATFRLDYVSTWMELVREVPDSEILRIEVFSVNSTVGPEGLCPMILLFETLPCHARKTLTRFRSNVSVLSEK